MFVTFTLLRDTKTLLESKINQLFKKGPRATCIDIFGKYQYAKTV